MLDCKACISRCIRTIFADVLDGSSQLRSSRRSTPSIQSHHHRGYHGTLRTAQGWGRVVYQPHQCQVAARHQTTHAFPSREASPVPPALSFWGNDEDQRTAPIHSVSRERSIIHKHPSTAHDPQRIRQLGKELVWLRDPVKLAENTIGLLRNDDHEKAIDTVRMASKNTSCTVSWNHLIDYDMSKGKVQKAVKIYNEMKKRGQQPDAQTYTILLRGLSWHPHLQESLPRALKIYHSMSADNCPVKPNIIHTNTVLKVCALAKDMDALWGVAAKLPTRGMGASNNLTFTIILNAIRSIAWQNDKDLPDESLDEKSLRRQRAVVQGRKMWEEIIPRWRAGDMWIDEELVCAMGRLLLLGSTERDFDDILSLAEQVMGIPRQKRKLSDRDELEVDQPAIAPRPVVDVGAPGPGGISVVEKGKVDPPGLENNESTSPPSASDTTLTPALTNVFRPASSSKITSTSISTPRPGRNTLSLLLDACISLRAIPSAQSYWGLLTSPTGPYNITPDSENYHMYLRLLRVQRASSLAADLVEDMHSGSLADMRMLAVKTFRIALSCCARDKNNVHATAHATRILRTMFQTLPYPDPRAMEMFTQLLLAVARTDFRVAVTGLQAMDPGMTVLNRAGNYGGGADRRREVLQLAQRFVGACDAVVGYAGDRLEREERKWLLQRKLMWSAWIQRTRSGLGERVRKGKEREMDERSRRRRGENEDATAAGGEGEEKEKEEEEGTVATTARRKMEERKRSGGGIIIPGSTQNRVGREKRMEAARRKMRRSGEFDFYGE